MAVLRIGEPNEKQRAFLLAREKYVAFGGARGGGKSWAVRVKAALLCLKYPGIKVLIVRRTYKELQNNHIEQLRGMLHGIARYNKSEKVFTFGSGSTISFGYCACDSDCDQYQGAEYDVIFLDEATQLDEAWIRKIAVCVRGVNDLPKRVYYTCNPGGRGHGYIKRLFIDRRFEPDETPDDYRFIQALATDNVALMRTQPDYLARLQALPPKLRQAWLYGQWDIFEGQFFEEFRTAPERAACEAAGCSEAELVAARRYTHVIPAFAPPLGWKLYRSFDFGYAKPFSCAWWAVDYDGRLYRILELYGCQRDRNGQDLANEGVKWDPDKIFGRIHEIEQTHPWLRGQDIQGVADPSIWDASRGESIADAAVRHGVYFTPGDNHRVAGWMQCHYRLSFDENGVPMCYIFDCCTAFIRTVPLLIYDEHDPEDLDTALEDHVADEWRYMCMARPMKPVQREEKRLPLNDPLDQFYGR